MAIDRAEIPRLAGGQLPARDAPARRVPRRTSAGADVAGCSSPRRRKLWFERCARAGFTVPTWPKEYGGAGYSREEAAILAAEMQRHPCPAAAGQLRHFDARPRSARNSARRSRKQTHLAAHRARRNPLVPGLFRTRRRLGPRLAAHQGRGPGRSFPRQRAEDLDLLRRQGRLDILPRANRSRRDQAEGHLLPADRHGDAGRFDQADRADLRQVAVLRDVLRQRRRAQGKSRWRRCIAAGTSPSTCSRTSAG